MVIIMFQKDFPLLRRLCHSELSVGRRLKDELVKIAPVLGPHIVPIARQGRSCDRWRSGSDADSITIGLMLSRAQVVGLMPAQYLEMVDRHRTNVGCKQRRCVCCIQMVQ